MIEYRQGDVLDAPSGSIIVHGCNARGVMGSGVAKAVKYRYPEAFEVYLRKFYTGGLILGEYTSYATPHKTLIVNGITQKSYGTKVQRYVDYEAVAQVFKNVVEDMVWTQGDPKCIHYDTIAFPKIGAGLGGGSWDVISAIIDEAIPDNWKKVCYVV
jgi:O-acetyl-ADP-ribose deacetylase (regulator of RNase III)